ncbi:MAG: glycosyltransferase family 2 protein [Magnetococcales bacterium]|nr:glycosyltransferase family 2 protein [Magnetococcales bacterium]
MNGAREPLPLSAVIIVCNEADNLPECLQSVAFAQEILVVDSGSVDDSAAVAQALGARVLYHPWSGYGPQKRYAVSQARFDWVLCLDADERVSPELAESLRRVMGDGVPRFLAWSMPRCNRFMGRWLRHGFGYPDVKVRFFHRDHARWSDAPVHEKVETEGPAGELRGDLLHASAESLERYLEKHNRYTTQQAELLLAAGDRGSAWRLVVNPIACFFKGYVLRLGFLDGLPGLVHTAIHCFTTLVKYAKVEQALQARKAEGASKER